MIPTPSIVNLPCGCFFSGREFIRNPKCAEHDEDDGLDSDPADIFAVIWCDFIPLSLRYEDPATAVSYAQEIHARSELAGIHLKDLRAVRLPALADELQTLWSPAHERV